MSISTRSPKNPLIRPLDVMPSRDDMEVLGVFNPGATRFNERTLLLVRVAERPLPEKGYASTAVLDEKSGQLSILRFRVDDPEVDLHDPRFIRYRGRSYTTSISHFRMAVCDDGGRFAVADAPAMFPEGPYERFGIEDARITKLDGTYYVNYTAVSCRGVVTALAKTHDFKFFERLGVIFGPDNKDVALFPERIDGRFYALHRPATKHIGNLAIWLASSNNLTDWGRHEFLIEPRPGQWDSERVGAGASPIRTRDGWLELYHASDHLTRYCTGALLLDLHEPWKVLARSAEPFLVPETPYEIDGFMPNVVFHSGLVEVGDGTLQLFYGAADESTCAVSVRVADILATLD